MTDVTINTINVRDRNGSLRINEIIENRTLAAAIRAVTPLKPANITKKTSRGLTELPIEKIAMIGTTNTVAIPRIKAVMPNTLFFETDSLFRFI
jgi:hypothetical protein